MHGPKLFQVDQIIFLGLLKWTVLQFQLRQ